MSVDIDALSRLSRLELSESEAERMRVDIESILSYMEAINAVDVAHESEPSEHRNVFRDDSNPNEPGVYTEGLLAGGKHVKEGKISVRRVLP